MHHLYVLKSLKDGKLYIGVSRDPGRRLMEHNRGKNKSTKPRRPFKLILSRTFATRQEAMKYEWFVKHTGEGNKSLKSKLPE